MRNSQMSKCTLLARTILFIRFQKYDNLKLVYKFDVHKLCKLSILSYSALMFEYMRYQFIFIIVLLVLLTTVLPEKYIQSYDWVTPDLFFNYSTSRT